MLNWEDVNYFGNVIPFAYPLLLSILLISNLFGFYSYLKRKIGYDAYLSGSQQLYEKIYEKNEVLSSLGENREVASPETVENISEKILKQKMDDN